MHIRVVFPLWSVFFLVLCMQVVAEPGVPNAEPGVRDDHILFGQTAALGGPAAALGTGMNTGIRAAFHEVNRTGGVHGRVLELLATDDGYEPERAIENTQRLIDDQGVFAMIGGVGTPTANAILPIITADKVPFIGPFTGAEFLRSPFKRYVVNVRASYWQETETWIKHLTEDLNISRIAILYQDDSYGRAGLSGVNLALEKRGLTLVDEATYKRNTTAVKAAVLSLRKSAPEAVVMVGAYAPCAEFIRLSRRLGFNPAFVNISFVGSDALSAALGDQGKGVIISQVVPFPFDAREGSIVNRYQQALREYDAGADFGFVSLEGYIVGRLVIEVLKHMNGAITREGFLDTLYSMERIQLDDLSLQYGVDDNQGMDQVFMTIIQEQGQFLPVERLEP